MAARPPGEPPVMRAARVMRAKHHVDCCLGPDEGEDPVPHARQEGQASSVIRHLRRWYQKSPIRRCFKPRPPWRAGCAGSPPAADRMSKEVRSLP
jgi:hypothetical protein